MMRALQRLTSRFLRGREQLAYGQPPHGVMLHYDGISYLLDDTAVRRDNIGTTAVWQLYGPPSLCVRPDDPPRYTVAGMPANTALKIVMVGSDWPGLMRFGTEDDD